MRQILLDNGFSYLGKCASCGGSAERYSKRMGTRQALLKVKEQSKSFVLTYSGSTTRGYEYNILDILKRYGLTETV
jgi:hypothetical protein